MTLRGLFTIQRLTTVMVACVCLSVATVAQEWVAVTMSASKL